MQINIQGPSDQGSDKHPLPPIHITLIYGSSNPPPPEKAKKPWLKWLSGGVTLIAIAEKVHGWLNK